MNIKAQYRTKLRRRDWMADSNETFACESSRSVHSSAAVQPLRGERPGSAEQAQRKRHAASWRRARQRLRDYDGPVRAAIMRRWACAGTSNDVGHLLSLMHLYDNGRLPLAGDGNG